MEVFTMLANVIQSLFTLWWKGRNMNMKKALWILGVFVWLFVAGCANRSLYYPSTPSLLSGRLWMGIILLIEIILGAVLTLRVKPEKAGEIIGRCLGSMVFGFVLGYLVFAEWGFRLLTWALKSTVGIVILTILSLAEGIFGLFDATVSTWIVNGFFWHSNDIAKWVIIPALIGGFIKILLILFVTKKAEYE
jgi:hypothetical protein